jgi:hypothetical protein
VQTEGATNKYIFVGGALWITKTTTA